jgi:hypothetical protein
MQIGLFTNDTQQVVMSPYNPIDFDAGVLPADFVPNPCIFKGQFEDAAESRVAATKCCPQEDCLNFEVKVTYFVSELN